jgi:hypothetical protein
MRRRGHAGTLRLQTRTKDDGDVAEHAAQNPGSQAGRGGLRRILDRFRRPSGVPAAASDDLAAELAPLFAVLDEIEAEAEEIRAGAERRVQSDRADTSEEVEAILVEAAHQAESERAEVAKAARRAAAAQAHSLVLAGEREAARIRSVGRERIPALCAEVVRCLETLPEQQR